MKKFLIFTSCIFFITNASAQKIEEKKIDEFTKSSIIRTSWETLTRGTMKDPLQSYARISRINNSTILDLKLMAGSVISIEKDARIMLKLENDSVVTLLYPKYQISCTGCGAVGFVGSAAQGLFLQIPLTSDIVALLLNLRVAKIRVYLNGGYVENEVKEKFGDTFKKQLELIKN